MACGIFGGYGGVDESVGYVDVDCGDGGAGWVGSHS